MSEQYAVVTIPVSSGEMYIDELRERGYSVITLVPYADVENMDEIFSHFKSYFGDRSTVIMGPKDLRDLAKCVEGYDVKAVFAGGEAGVRCADELARQLGLEGNDPKTTWLRNNKEGMTHALRDAGLRAIETQKVRCEQDIIDFWNANGCEKAVMKFAESGATVGVQICPSLQYALDYYKKMQTMPNFIGVVGGDILIQEYIGGIEHVVDTVSCNGKHKVTDCWTYTKFLSGNNILYGRSKFQSRISPEFEEMIDYTLKVLDAVGLKFGPCHTEIKYDHKGPVLIETNPRPHGASMKREFNRSFTDNCIVDASAEALLDREAFFRRPDVYVSKQSAMFIILTNLREGKISLSPALALFENIRGYLYTTPERRDVWECPETIDLQSSPANSKFVGSEELIDTVYEKAHRINLEYPDLLFSFAELKGCGDAEIPDLDGTAAVYDDCVRPLKERCEQYDIGIFAAKASEPLADRYTKLFELMRCIRDGGSVVVPKTMCDTMPYGKEGMKMVFDLFGMPVSESSDGGVIAKLESDILVRP